MGNNGGWAFITVKERLRELAVEIAFLQNAHMYLDLRLAGNRVMIDDRLFESQVEMTELSQMDKKDIWNGHVMHAFTPDTAEEVAVTAFARRYGRQPEIVMREYGMLLVGPVEEDKKDDPR
jgi:hypothetical protein